MLHYGRGKDAYPPRFYRGTFLVQLRALRIAWFRLRRQVLEAIGEVAFGD